MRFAPLPYLFGSIFVAWIAVAPASQPNVIVIMADDLGYGDVSCYGATAFETPNIDRLAAGGQRFTSGYCSASTCTPTRFSFLTGHYAFRTPGTGIASPNSPALVAEGTPTIASMFQSAGYRTAVIGKWHLGLGDPAPDWNGSLRPGPLEIGFDHCVLLPTTNDRVPQVYVRDHFVADLDPADPLWVGDVLPTPDHPTGETNRDELAMDWSHGHNQTIHNGISRIGFYTGGHAARFRDQDLADKWVDESIDWMRRKESQPFFLFFASHDLHVPRAVHERFLGKSGVGPRGDAIIELDWCVGAIMDELDRRGLTDSTMIVFCSDNGPVLDDGYKDDAIEKLGTHQPAGPFRGGKYNVYEGGTRTPLITHWPGRIPTGVSDEIVCTIDLVRSFATMLDVQVPEGQFADSVDVSGALTGSTGAKGRESLVQQDNGQSGNFGFRRGDWKLIRHGRPRVNNVNLSLVQTVVQPWELYDLRSDPGETNNLVEERPEIAESMKAELRGLTVAGNE